MSTARNPRESLALSLIWANHIGADRALGFGLKYAAGFGWTHLGRVGKARAGLMRAQE